MAYFMTLARLAGASFSLIAATPAWAQRTGENAIADAEDAFGSTQGTETLGIYAPGSVRGFSPIDAGNVRLDGLYVDRQGEFSPRLVAGNRIRVGPSATSYAFPAPSGVVDYRLRVPGGDPMLSIVGQANSWGGRLLEIDAQLPLASGISVGGGASISRSEYPSGNNADIRNAAIIGSWQPGTGRGLNMFWSRTRIADEDIYPIILSDGTDTPARLTRRRFLGQPWADVETERHLYGVTGKATLAGFAVRGGIFRSVNDVSEGHNVFLNTGQPGAIAARSVSAYPGRRSAATSGELGLARSFASDRFEHRIQLVVRARDQHRRYGGSDRVMLPPALYDRPDFVAQPQFAFSPQTIDRVRQWSMGLDYQLRIPSLGQLSGGVQKVDYRKRVTTPLAPQPESRDAPWLFNAAASLDLMPKLTGYASYTRGLEESDVAPETAVNRDEAPPAIRTRQLDAGLKLGVAGLTVIAGAFAISRPYYGVDRANFFRRLGSVQHRGLELSVTGSPAPGLVLVAGGTLVRARLSGDEVRVGTIGNRPIDVPARKLIANLDWHPPGSPTSIDIAIDHVGPNTADALNHVRVEPYTIVNSGIRHRLKLGGASAVLRLQATNLFNAYGWEVAGNNAFVYIQPRQLLARLAIDL